MSSRHTYVGSARNREGRAGHPSTLAKKHAKDEIRQRPEHGLVVTVDDALDILGTERRKLKRKGEYAYEKTLAPYLLHEVHLETGDTTFISSGKQGASNVPHTSSTLALMPPQVSPECVSEIMSELHRVRAALSVEKVEVERLQRIVSQPFAAFDATAIDRPNCEKQ